MRILKKIGLILSFMFLSIGLFGCQQSSEDENDNQDIKTVAWKFIEEKGWNTNAKEDWQGAEIKETIADNSYELLDNNYEGKKALSVSFEDKENVVIGTPLILVDPTTKRVIGYMSGE